MARKQSTESRPAVSAEGAAVPAKHRTSRPRTPKTVKPASESAAVPEPVQATFVDAADGGSAAPDIAVVSAAAGPASEHEEIARLAYEFWEARGREHGSAEQDWVRAEQEYRRLKAGL